MGNRKIIVELFERKLKLKRDDIHLDKSITISKLEDTKNRLDLNSNLNNKTKENIDKINLIIKRISNEDDFTLGKFKKIMKEHYPELNWTITYESKNKNLNLEFDTKQIDYVFYGAIFKQKKDINNSIKKEHFLVPLARGETKDGLGINILYQLNSELSNINYIPLFLGVKIGEKIQKKI